MAEAKAAAGLPTETRTSRRIPTDELLDARQALADDLGHAPTHPEMYEHDRSSQRPYYRRWDSWADALTAAGCESERESDT